MGSAALFFAIEPAAAVLSDINSSLVETLCAVRDHPRAVCNRLHRLPQGKEAYYRIREEDATQLSSLDRAARFVYLNRFCFNGLYRTNLKGKFNVPYAASKTGQLPSQEVLFKAAKILSCAQITTNDFDETLKTVQPGDFVYMDPPYAVQNSKIFRQYGPDCFGTDDLARLASALPDIDSCGATFLVSYAMCQEALEAFDGWHIQRVQTQRSVAGFSRHRREAIEILVSNCKLPDEFN
jgi:DNA adenine methylase